jgi:hypothetical protein
VEKLITVAFDLGNLLLLMVILRRWRIPPAWALFYWLGPYFLVIDWNGYADPQTSFFVLAALAVLGEQAKPSRSALAGVLFAIALLLKPQALVLAAMLLAYSFARALRHRDWDVRSRSALMLLVPSVVALVGWSIAFTLAGRGPTLLAQPMVFAAAHENHFFLAAVLCSLLCLRLGSVAGLVALTASLLVQTVNLLGGFGLGGSPLAAPEPVLWLVRHYTSGVLVALAAANVMALAAGALVVVRRVRTSPFFGLASGPG